MPPSTPPQHPRRPGYTVVEPRDGRGARFVAFSLTTAQAAALTAEARRLGIQATDSSQFITSSESH